MRIETTMYFNRALLEELSKASEKVGKSRTCILVLLLKRAMGDSYRLAKSFSPVKYQKSDPSQNWHRLHIQLNEYEYEYCLDMRKLYKMSVSLIVAYTVSRYLVEIVKKLLETDIDKFTDNYLPKNYILVREVINSTICWRIYWGIPYNLDKIVPSTILE